MAVAAACLVATTAARSALVAGVAAYSVAIIAAVVVADFLVIIVREISIVEATSAPRTTAIPTTITWPSRRPVALNRLCSNLHVALNRPIAAHRTVTSPPAITVEALHRGAAALAATAVHLTGRDIRQVIATSITVDSRRAVNIMLTPNRPAPDNMTRSNFLIS